MAAGDWSAQCKVRPYNLVLMFDGNTPPNIIGIDVNYYVVQPSGSDIPRMYAWNPAQPIPVAQGLVAIQDAVQATTAYEGLGVG